MLKFLFKAFAVCVMAVAVIIAGIVLYMSFYGNALVERSLSSMLGSQVTFRSAAINLDARAVSFNDLSIASEIDLTSKAFNAEKVTVILNKEKLDKEKKIVLDELYVKKGILNIERKQSGELMVVLFGKLDTAQSGPVIGGGGETRSGTLYGLAGSTRKVTIEDSVINLKDYSVAGSANPYDIYCDKLNVSIISRQVPGPAGEIPVLLTVSLRIPEVKTGDGTLALRADMAVYPGRVDMEASLNTKRINLMLFIPYLNRSTPFIFFDGLFSSNTSFRMHDRIIDSPTTLVFHRLSFSIKPGMLNTQFLSVSPNQLAKYLTSSGGDILFDFVVQGPVERPTVGLGPKVKYAIGMVAMEEVGKIVQQMGRVQ